MESKLIAFNDYPCNFEGSTKIYREVNNKRVAFNGYPHKFEGSPEIYRDVSS